MSPQPTSPLQRDIILIAGQTSVGKTTAYNMLSGLAAAHDIPIAAKPVTDLAFFLDRIRIDDQQGGRGHYHSWCVPGGPETPGGHTHTDVANMLPFAVTSQEIVDGALYDFFSALSRLPRDGRLHFVTLTAGKNMNGPGSPQAGIDISSTRMCELLGSHAFPAAWLTRVRGVVHPFASRRDRLQANHGRPALHHHETRDDRVSHRKEFSVLDTFGEDDFAALVPLLQEHGTYHIYAIENTFDAAFAEQVSALGRTLFGRAPGSAAAGSGTKRDVVLVIGQSSAGKAQVLAQLQHRAAQKDIPVQEGCLSDYPFLVEEVRRDDRQGGAGHYHAWCDGQAGGHRHVFGEADQTFTVTSNEIIDRMQQAFFTTISAMPASHQLKFAQFSGGENTNPFSEPAYRADFSFKRLAGRIAADALPDGWIDRVFAVIHPVVPSDEIRARLNDVEYIQSLSNDQHIIRTKRSRTILNIFGKDDFIHLERMLQQRGVPHIYTVRQDGSDLFLLRLDQIVDELLELYKASLPAPPDGSAAPAG